jgi:hypothetical protein
VANIDLERHFIFLLIAAFVPWFTVSLPCTFNLGG